MNVTLYSTGCPKCHVLEMKLKEVGVNFDLVKDEDLMIQKGFMTAPMLEVDGISMDFSAAIKWVNQKKEG